MLKHCHRVFEGSHRVFEGSQCLNLISFNYQVPRPSTMSQQNQYLNAVTMRKMIEKIK